MHSASVRQAPWREIPYNYTSADDEQVVRFLLGQDVWKSMELLRGQRVTGRSARLLLRVMGELFVVRRNPFLYQELADSAGRRRRFLAGVNHDLGIIQRNSAGNTEVIEIIGRCRDLLKVLMRELASCGQRRARIRSALGAVVGPDNVLFDPFTLTAHVTDATDWRLHVPVAVALPGREEEVAPLLSAIGALGLKAIPRGAGTGLTGGAVPLAENCVIINTERLNRIRGIGEAESGGRKIAMMEVEAGAVTEQAMDAAEQQGLVFATDPTSAWACTVGGNIAENAGGKTAVLWGTAVDNLLSWNLALPTGRACTVTRLDHPMRKIRPDDVLRFEVAEEGQETRVITLPADGLRRKGLWKDITNKALSGLPGLQKEGTDGVITSARFVLHKAYPHKATACLEFFGADMEEASRVILALADTFPDRGAETLQALEHFDEEYVEAIGYKVKSARGGRPKAVLLIDMVAWAPEQLAEGMARLKALLEPYPSTETFVARDAAEAKAFWADRKKLGAIARRTNAFKLNEDVVLPLAQLAPFAAFIEGLNLEEERHNHERVITRLIDELGATEPGEDRAWVEAKLPAAQALAAEVREACGRAAKGELRTARALRELRDRLCGWFAGYQGLAERLKRAYAAERGRLIVIATHMHAGDGNVHVNIPVFSNDREMMRRAHAAAAMAMRKAVELGGVVSGEHGIGITKIEFLEPERIEELNNHRRQVDPDNLMNPHKLQDPAILRQVFTPSFNLLNLEARILQHGHLAELAQKIQSCIRCGKCKPDCCVFFPARNLFYHPRNKNLAIGGIIEALLYEAQRSRSTRFEMLKHLQDVADHCTICHKCLKPCPVEIDTGEVSILERDILKAAKFKKTAMATRLSLAYLRHRSPAFGAAFRLGVLGAGMTGQRLASRAAGLLPLGGGLRRMWPLSMLATPLPKAHGGTLQDVLPQCGLHQALLVHPKGVPTRTAFYFPGCGSERMYSDVSKAGLYILLKAGVQVVLPPPSLCCGYPFAVNAQESLRRRIELRDTIIFSQIKDMFSYMTFDACAFSCGTCLEALERMGTQGIFNAPMRDISELALEAGLTVPALGEVLYHKPCHDSLKSNAKRVIAKAGGTAHPTPHCCGEAGTMSLSRPDISGSLVERKGIALRDAMACHRTGTVLTNCPSCLQGLGRHQREGVQVKHLAIALAEAAGGKGWKQELRRMLEDRVEVVTI